MRLQPVFNNLTSGSRLMMLVIVVLLCGILSVSFSYLISIAIWGKSVFFDAGNPETLNLDFLRFTQMINQVGIFLIPPVIFAWLSYKSPAAFLGFIKPDSKHLIAAIVLIIVAGPFTGFLVSLNEGLQLPDQLSGITDWMRSSEDVAAKLTNRFLEAPGTVSLIINIIMIGLLPAIGEELLFRSSLIGIFKRMFKGIHLPVIISAFIFSALHLQFFGFLPRFMLGLVFGYLYVWSGSIWIPVTAHFINNTSVVIASYLYNQGLISIDVNEMGNSDSALWIGLSTLSVFLILIWVYSTRRKTSEICQHPQSNIFNGF
jgi:hypothetical protein